MAAMSYSWSGRYSDESYIQTLASSYLTPYFLKNLSRFGRPDRGTSAQPRDSFVPASSKVNMEKDLSPSTASNSFDIITKMRRFRGTFVIITKDLRWSRSVFQGGASTAKLSRALSIRFRGLPGYLPSGVKCPRGLVSVFALAYIIGIHASIFAWA